MAGINFKAFDLGGHEIARRVWKDYYAKVTVKEGFLLSFSVRYRYCGITASICAVGTRLVHAYPFVLIVMAAVRVKL